MRKKQYECMILFDVQLSEEERAEKIDEIKRIIKSDKENEVLKTIDLGIKPLAYPIKKRKNGYYYLFYFVADTKSTARIHNKIKYLEGILRFLIVSSTEDIINEQEKVQEEETEQKEEAKEAEVKEEIRSN
ncbi:MAG TPA: 30S ribosomal protein S6 [bacterium]|nr:30S ribosomal protein S6 [bacterium]